MKQVYPIELIKTETGYVVFVPDMQINTEGKDIADAIFMARDAISLCGITMQDDHQSVPAPSPIEKVKPENGGFITLVDVDFEEYRKKNDMRAIKKNCTVPAWLCYAAEQAGINFSQTLQAGLKAQLHIND